MPRGPRLDAPGALHHVIARGIEQCAIFRDDNDREALLARLGVLVRRGAFDVFAWALMTNHFHLLVRSGVLSLSRSMRCLLTGYAGYFNRRHERAGHLFQNRYKSIVCDEESYFLQLVRYIHLNPLVGGLVPDVEALEVYPYSGHSVVIGRHFRWWQATMGVLERFANRPAEAVGLYRDFVRAGAAVAPSQDFEGGGLVRSVGGWAAVKRLRRGREAYKADERVLGKSEFVERVLKELGDERSSYAGRSVSFEDLARLVCQATGAGLDAVLGGTRARTCSLARDALAYLWIEVLGRSGRELARKLGVDPSSVYRSSRRGRAQAARWRALLNQNCH